MSFSTIALVQVLAESGVLTASARDKILVDSVERHYNAAIASHELLVEAAAPSRTLHATRSTFALLAAPAMDMLGAARILVRAIKSLALSPIRTTSTTQIAKIWVGGNVTPVSHISSRTIGESSGGGRTSAAAE